MSEYFDCKMSQSQENNTKFIEDLTKYLKENQFKEALNLFKGDDYDDVIKEISWDIVPITSSYLTTENAKCNSDLIECCTDILNVVAEKCNPSEVILQLLEQIENPEEDVKFCIILSVLTKSISKMNDKTKALEWCISTIRSYVESLSIPNKECKDKTMVGRRIQCVYTTIMTFLESLVEEAALRNTDSEKCIILKDYVLSVLIYLMGRPLCQIEEESEAWFNQNFPERIIMLANRLNRDLLWFLNIIDKKSRKSNSKPKNMNEESNNLKVMLFELNENVPDLAYANFYFYIITKSHLWEKVPQIYDSQYVFQSCIYLIIKLIQEQGNIAITKGLNLLDHLLPRISTHSFTSELLELHIYSELFDVLVKVMVYCDNAKARRRALHIFEKYIEVFDIQARYCIVLRLYQKCEHSGLLSLTTGIFKESIIECLEAVPPIPYFLGNNLESMLKLACRLPHGSASDLVELSDEIITSLNLLRFLFIRDKNNRTGIWNLVDKLESEYLKPLREGISLCRAHWKVKIKDLEEQKKIHRTSDSVELQKDDTEVILTVGGEKLPAMPVPEKISFCYQAVNGLDVMESILIRVNECIADRPS